MAGGRVVTRNRDGVKGMRNKRKRIMSQRRAEEVEKQELRTEKFAKNKHKIESYKRPHREERSERDANDPNRRKFQRSANLNNAFDSLER